MHFDIQRLIDDLGGASSVARALDIGRTVPYGWTRRAFISSDYLSRIKGVWPELDLDQYFIAEDHIERHTERSARVPREGLVCNSD